MEGRRENSGSGNRETQVIPWLSGRAQRETVRLCMDLGTEVIWHVPGVRVGQACGCSFCAGGQQTVARGPRPDPTPGSGNGIFLEHSQHPFVLHIICRSFCAAMVELGNCHRISRLKSENIYDLALCRQSADP